MKLSATLYRSAQFRTSDLLANLPAGSELADVERLTKTRFGELAPRLVLFIEARRSIASMEVMRFDLGDPDVAKAGIVTADPMDPIELARIDGALRGELERLGIDSRPEQYSWRMSYSVSGN